MKQPKPSPVFEPGKGYTSDDWKAVDSPHLSEAELVTARPFAEAFPELAASIRRGRGKQKAPTKIRVTLRLERSTVDAFKATGEGWQTRIDEALKGLLPKTG